MIPRRYNGNAGRFRFATPHVKFASIGAFVLALALALALVLPLLPLERGEQGPLAGIYVSLAHLSILLLLVGIILLALAVCLYMKISDATMIATQVRQGLFDPGRGNPLHLVDGELLPRVRCVRLSEGQYDLTIEAKPGVTVEAINNITSAVSASLTHRYQQYAVTQTDADVAYGEVTLRIENVKVDHSITYTAVEQMQPQRPICLSVDATNSIDLTTSGSILVAGKTRSGKTTGVISLLLQVLLSGPDDYGSSVIIVDPKQAELSRLPHTVTIDENGEGRAILEALRDYAATIVRRQQVLNDLSVACGDAVHWWDAGMQPSFIFVDEFVACRSIFPKKAPKDGDYCIDTFDAMIKRIVTMGASAGCYVIISIAEASVQEGGLPAMLRSAMSTRILFRPTRSEGLLIWDKEHLNTTPERVYGPGDAWFSSTDGIHDAVSCVHFPRMTFAVYRELGRLLRDYYDS